MLGAKLQTARLAAGLTQEVVAERAKITREYVSQLERGQQSPTVDVLLRVCRAMDVSAGKMLLELEKGGD